MNTRSFAIRMSIFAVGAVLLYATTFGDYPFFKTWAAVLLGALLIAGLVHTVRSYAKSRSINKAKHHIAKVRGDLAIALHQQDPYNNLSLEGANRFNAACRRAQNTLRNIDDRAGELERHQLWGMALGPGSSWNELGAAAQDLRKEIGQAHYWCSQDLRGDLAPGLMSANYQSPVFNFQAQDPHRQDSPNTYPASQSTNASNSPWMRPNSHHQGYPSSHQTAAASSPTRRPVRNYTARVVVPMSEYEHLRNHHTGPFAGKVIQFPRSPFGRHRR